MQQVTVGSCTNGSYTDLQAVARIVWGRRVHSDVFFVHPNSRTALELLAREGLLVDLIAAGVNVSEATCGACVSFDHVPGPGTRSVRATNRNFKERSGLADDEVYLTSAESAAAALQGELVDPHDLTRDLGIAAPPPDLFDAFPQDNPLLVPPLPEDAARGLAVGRGLNMQPAPVKTSYASAPTSPGRASSLFTGSTPTSARPHPTGRSPWLRRKAGRCPEATGWPGASSICRG
ncbi:MAG: aconitase family protein [Armatimonadota bacterium]|nr:aconitase family protein [Armatimonadota bacterium]